MKVILMLIFHPLILPIIICPPHALLAQPECSIHFHFSISSSSTFSFRPRYYQCHVSFTVGTSVFTSSAELRFVSSLHGLDVTTTCDTRSLKLRLHIINGDCFSDRCEASRHPDRSACLSIAAGFSSPLAITEFTVQLLKGSSASVFSMENLLLVVESTGTQGPYENRLNLRRRVLTSLDTFLRICQYRACSRTGTVTNNLYNVHGVRKEASACPSVYYESPWPLNLCRP
jgi:hypothetical protein